MVICHFLDYQLYPLRPFRLSYSEIKGDPLRGGASGKTLGFATPLLAKVATPSEEHTNCIKKLCSHQILAKVPKSR